MAGLGSVLNTARDALAAQSFGLSVTGQNIANASTPGYVRREAVLQTKAIGGQTYGTVEVQGLRRATDMFTTRRLYESVGLGSAASEHQRQLAQVEALFNDFQGAGMADSLDQLFGSFSSLAANPSDPSSRIGVLDRVATFASRANATANALVTQEGELLQQARETVTATNERAQDLARVEAQISIARASGGDAADLLQERESLLRDLGEMVDIRVIENGDGSIMVQAAGSTLVEGTRANALSLDLDANGQIRLFGSTAGGRSTEITRYLTGGKLAGIKEARDVDIFNVKTKLDELVFGVGTAINTQHAAGFGLDGQNGRDLFDLPATAAGAARAIRVSADVLDRPEAIAAAGSATSLPGGSDNAIALVRIGSSPILNGNTETPGSAYGALVADVGLRSRRAQDTAEHREAVHAQLENLFQQQSGVSLDEEMIQLSKFQRAFEASSKVLTIVDQLLAELMQAI
jgi:flagellar hook-associated protein 1 FlgK